jgi:serine/threonine protein kinase
MWQIGPYQVIEEIGRGGMGVVYRGVDPAIGRSVAVKTLILEHTQNSEEQDFLRHRLIREAQSAGMLSHPNIVTIYQMGQDGGKVFIAMEFVHGCTLDALLNRGQMTIEAILGIIDQTAHALDYAHRKGVVHRDIKPSNVMIDTDRNVKITDFGLARVIEGQSLHTQTGMVLGSAHYMSPEQIQGRSVDGRSDQYSLAVMAYRSLTGERPFSADQLTALFYQILMELPEPVQHWNPSLTEAVDHVLNKAMAKKVEDRYATCHEFAADLRRATQTPSGHFRAMESESHVPASGQYGLSGSTAGRSHHHGETLLPDSARAAGGIAERTPSAPTLMPQYLTSPEGEVHLVTRETRSKRLKALWFVAGACGLALAAGVALYVGDHTKRATSPLTINTMALPVGQSGSLYEAIIEASGGTQPYKWSGTSIPPGLRIDAAGHLSGIPQQDGRFWLQLKVIDSQGQSASRDITLTFDPQAKMEVPTRRGEPDPPTRKEQKVEEAKKEPPIKRDTPPPPPPLSIHRGQLASGITGKSYEHTFTAEGGTPPYHWSITGNRLPEGLQMEQSGHLTGVPKQTGEFRATAHVTDSRAAAADREFFLAIKPGLVVRPALPLDQYFGPTRGSIRWTGSLAPLAKLTIEGGTVSEGSLNGDFPRIPVKVSVTTRDVEVIEAPSAANQWDRVVIRNNSSSPIANVMLQWNVSR